MPCSALASWNSGLSPFSSHSDRWMWRGGAREVVAPLGHEGDGLALQVRDLLDGVLQDGVAVGHLQRIGVADVDLFLARPPLALGVLDRDAGPLQPAADGAHHALLLGGLQDVVVLDVGAGRLQACDSAWPRPLRSSRRTGRTPARRRQKAAHLRARQAARSAA